MITIEQLKDVKELPPLCHIIKISIYNYFCKKEFNLYITKC